MLEYYEAWRAGGRAWGTLALRMLHVMQACTLPGYGTTRYHAWQILIPDERP